MAGGGQREYTTFPYTMTVSEMYKVGSCVIMSITRHVFVVKFCSCHPVCKLSDKSSLSGVDVLQLQFRKRAFMNV